MRRVIMAALLAISTGGTVLGGSSVAAASPAAITGYHATGTISPAGEANQCLTAGHAKAGAQILVFGCVPGNADALQQWVAIAIGGTVLVALEGHPDLCIGGVPGDHGSVELFDCGGNVIPFRQATSLSGSVKRHGAVNGIQSLTRQWLSLPTRGHTVYWRGRFARGNNRRWVFNGGWIPETIEAVR